MKIRNLIILLCLLGVYSLTYQWGYSNGHDEGYAKGYSDTPINVLHIESIAVERDNGFIRFSVISDNTTYTVISLANDKPDLQTFTFDEYIK